MISLQGVSKIYKKDKVEILALDKVSLNIVEGEFVAITGPSGSGKSTLMNIIGCLDRPTEGVYFLEGVDVSKLQDKQLAKIRNQKIGFIFQNFNLLQGYNCIKNVALPLFYAGVNKETSKKMAIEVLNKVNLSDRLNHRPSELSGGQMQRVAIARALVNNPKIILADEPTGNLDSKTGHEIMQIFIRLNQEGRTIILVTHEEEFASFAKRQVRLKDGRVIE